MPCLEPVMMMVEGVDADDWMRGRKVEMPFITPKRLVSMTWIKGEINYALALFDLWRSIPFFGWKVESGKGESRTLWKYSVSSHPLFVPMPAFSIRKSTFLNLLSTFSRRSFHSSILLTSIV